MLEGLGTILHTVQQSAPSEIHKSSFNWPQLWCELGVVDWMGWMGKGVGKNMPKSNQATDWLHLILSNSYKLPTTLRAKTGRKLEAGMERQIFLFFPCPLCECLPLAGIPSTPAPISTLQYCYVTYIMLISYNAYILKQRSIGATSEKHFFPAKVGAKYAAGPTEPPRMPNFQQMSMI
jgi:hypothetical protein